MDSKVLLALGSVGFGWLLGQGTAIAKDWWSSRMLRIGLQTELEDIQNQLQRVALIHMRQLQIFAHKGMEPTAALPVQNLFFKHYYKDVFPYLSREQRISYQLIHASLDDLNQKNVELAKFFTEADKDLKLLPDEKKALTTINLWGDHVTALYMSTMDVQWHIAYHLQHAKAPTFDLMGPMHESYVKFQEQVAENVKSIIEKAKTLKKEDFAKIYDPTAFSKKQNSG